MRHIKKRSQAALSIIIDGSLTFLTLTDGTVLAHRFFIIRSHQMTITIQCPQESSQKIQSNRTLLSSPTPSSPSSSFSNGSIHPRQISAEAEAAMEDSSRVDPQLLLSHKFPEGTYTYTERDVALYALGVGACAHDAVDADELKYVHHESGLRFIQVLPTFAALFSLGAVPLDKDIPGLRFDPRLLLHGQQYIELYRPLPSRATLKNKASVVGLHDKGKAAVLETEVRCFDEGSGELLCMNRITTYLRGAGGFSESSKPYSYSNYPPNQVSAIRIPKEQPFSVFEDQTQPSQALLYRLSGDYNPLHSDPTFAKVAGFSRPILHGLCTLGFAVRAIIKRICRGDSSMVKNILGRFLLHVYPGETLMTEMWIEGSRVIYQTKVKERNRAVLSGA
ncbi:enoyl-CoA hydratase 2, peroxisomal isoform X2 [Punica granatum]|uniref:Enoyl-CoA hydratase 2, peroxisomal isoform X2 n=1 Tax=Punica granatum TaxID=22663 RepID=A0A6P8ELS7_PUNGR|nr:enoyl-CoA hydratase 2, peroxisomal isoform X2 [Punica granatum]